MTSTLSPEDTGEIDLLGGATQNLAPYASLLPPTLRRPDATGEIPRLDDQPVQPLFPLERVLTTGDITADRPDAAKAKTARVRGGRHRLHRPSLLARTVTALTGLVRR